MAASVSLLALTGCAPAASSTAGGGSSSSQGGPSPASTPDAHAQGKFSGVPKQCPSADDISVALHMSLPEVDTFSTSPLICTYHNSANSAVQLSFAAVPAGTTIDQYKAEEIKATPGIQSVPGVGDAAFYLSTPQFASEFKFLSNGVYCNITSPLIKFDQTHMVALAESLLEG
jgi:hypothetical protein